MDEDKLVIEGPARIAVYDNLLSAPRVVDIPPQEITQFIDNIAVTSYDLSKQQGGQLPYTVIREIAENFIHAGFLECTVSILDEGNTLRFADQGPGIPKKDLVLRPGVSSARGWMKDYIRGVGSGFPVVREYLAVSHGYLTIEDNAEDGVVVTISLGLKTAPALEQEVLPSDGKATYPDNSPAVPLSTEPGSLQIPDITLSSREEQALLLLKEYGILGPVDLAELLGVSAATATRLLKKMELQKMVESAPNKKRILSNAGMAYVQGLLLEV